MVLTKSEFQSIPKQGHALSMPFGDSGFHQLRNLMIGQHGMHPGVRSHQICGLQQHPVRKIHAIHEMFAMDQFVQNQMAVFTLFQTGHPQQRFKMERVVMQISTHQQRAMPRQHIDRSLTA